MCSWLARGRLLLWFGGLACSVLGCSVYDAALLEASDQCGDGDVQAGEFCDMGIAPDRVGGCPSDCPSADPCTPREVIGRGCQRRCVDTPVTAPIHGDGCCPSDAFDARTDDDCGHCGDFVTSPGETCDPPESCPAEESCVATTSCVTMVYSGRPEECTASCLPNAIEVCRTGDGCCPANCAASDDGDCSEACGDGRIDADAGETCEPLDSATACPASCDDGDPCTRDLLIGSPENCNVSCSNIPRAASTRADGCCPAGGESANDPECQPACDDGTSSEGPGCITEAAPAGSRSEQCMMFTGAWSVSPACARCSCAECSSAILQCYAGGRPERDGQCAPALECAVDYRCNPNSNGCYCGPSLRCATSPEGPCASEYAAAAPSPTLGSVQACATDASCALYWTREVRECMTANCYAACYR